MLTSEVNIEIMINNHECTTTNKDNQTYQSEENNTNDEQTQQAPDDPFGNNDQFIGDILNEVKPPNVTRLYIQNINGIKWDKDGGTWPMICDTVTAINSDITCFAELNQDVNNHRLSGKMRAIEQRFFSHSRFAASTSKNKVTKTYKPGGTSILVTEKTTSSIKKFTKDRMGRWVVAHITGKPGTKIALIMAYQVCQSKVTGNTTAANCQIAQLITESEFATSIPNPRKVFIADLTQLITQFQARGESILLLGDFNDDMHSTLSNQEGIAKLAITCELADVFAIRLGDPTIPTTYQRGSKSLTSH